MFRSIWFSNARALAGASLLVSSELGQRRAAMEVSVARLPPHWGFVVCCGVAELVRTLEAATPDAADVKLARQIGCVSPTLASLLATAPNAVDVNVPLEGAVLFAGDPIATLEGPLWQMWLVVDAVQSILRAATLVATRAARLTLASGKANVIDGTSCNAMHPDQAVAIARAASIGGAVATQSPQAASVLGVDLRFTPSSEAVSLSQDEGAVRTSAWAVQSSADGILVHLGPGHDEEETMAELRRLGVARGSWVARGLTREADGFDLRADLVALEQDGVWTARLGVIPDATVNPGRKLLVRYLDAAGRPIADVLHSVAERIQPAAEAQIVGHQGINAPSPIEGSVSAVPLMVSVVRSGRRVGAEDSMDGCRRRLSDALSALPLPLKRLRYPSKFPVGLSPSLAKLKADLFVQLA